jgi:hypothetical protein
MSVSLGHYTSLSSFKSTLKRKLTCVQAMVTIDGHQERLVGKSSKSFLSTRESTSYLHLINTERWSWAGKQDSYPCQQIYSDNLHPSDREPASARPCRSGNGSLLAAYDIELDDGGCLKSSRRLKEGERGNMWYAYVGTNPG